MPTPTNPIENKMIPRSSYFYQHYFQDFVSKATPMCKLLKKNEIFLWTKTCVKSWEWMKASMTCLHILIYLTRS
jgi:hypothetical protein